MRVTILALLVTLLPPPLRGRVGVGGEGPVSPTGGKEAVLRVGFGEADISPKLGGKRPVYIAGFGQNRIATKIHDPLFARA